MRKMSPRALATSALIAAVYTALSLSLPMLSFQAVQMRLSECLTLLPVLSPLAVWGVTVGCFLTNLIGAAMGLTMPMDILFGTLATLIAAVLSYLSRRVRFFRLPILSAIWPVLVNGLVIGFELCWISGTWDWNSFLFLSGSVAAGQILPCLVLGLGLVWLLEQKGLAQRLFSDRR
ncbi:MAG: QueT transporter family protein [Oscillospiraceae bacterium]|nr:QueT transporter family protein [Oscillospiraceae bacterium]